MSSKVYDLTTGSINKNLLRFVAPYLFSCFMQTLYGLVDLMIVGQFGGTSTTSAVSIGSQAIHMLTVIIAGLSMGCTVKIARSVGENNLNDARDSVKTSGIFFSIVAAVITVVLFVLTGGIVALLSTPVEAVDETISYLRISFLGVPFIFAFNIISGIFRGAGDSRRPMYFALISSVANIILDIIFVAVLGMGASGAAIGTIISQALSSVIALVYMIAKPFSFMSVGRSHYNSNVLRNILRNGVPISLQDGLIQIAFIVITVFANRRGVIDSAAVGISEKLICFYFLVPSAFLSAISAITAQNTGAGKPERAIKTLKTGLLICTTYALFIAIMNQIIPGFFIGLFTNDSEVIASGVNYLRPYASDTVFASIHFCLSGYFCGVGRSELSFVHNIISVAAVRIPGSILGSLLFPMTLLPMGLAAPLGSLLSVFICLAFYKRIKRNELARIQLSN